MTMISLSLFFFFFARTMMAAEAPPLLAPTPLHPAAVEYPAGGDGRSASVLLELVVAADGRVSEVIVVDGTEPFTAAASEAAASWTYAPARRGDRVVQARIRVRIDFAPQVANPRDYEPIPPTQASLPGLGTGPGLRPQRAPAVDEVPSVRPRFVNFPERSAMRFEPSKCSQA
jgi:TonB family protein